MLVNREDYLKHWGVKGMKWDSDKKKTQNVKLKSEKDRLAAEEVEAGKNGLVRENGGYGPSGFMDQHGNVFEGSLSDAIKKKKENDAYYTKHARPNQLSLLTPSQRKSANAAAQLSKQYSKPKSGAAIFLASTKAANKPTINNVKKGKSFIDKLFNR